MVIGCVTTGGERQLSHRGVLKDELGLVIAGNGEGGVKGDLRVDWSDSIWG